MNLRKFYFIGFNPLKVFQSRPNVWMILFPNFRQRMSMPKGNVQKSSLGCKDRYFCMRTPSSGLFGSVTMARNSSPHKKIEISAMLRLWAQLYEFGRDLDSTLILCLIATICQFIFTWALIISMCHTPHCTNNEFNCPFLIKFTFRNTSTKRKKQLLYQLIIDHFLLIEHVSNTSVQSNHIVDGAKIYRTLMTSIFTN